jgi:uncharacterized membrane-anchored protein
MRMSLRPFPFLLLFCSLLFAQTPDSASSKAISFNYQTGAIHLANDLATVTLAEDYRYLDPAQADVVLQTLWGNPPGMQTLGMIFPKDVNPADSTSWGIVIEFEEEGYIKDKDAEKINYDNLLKKMQKSIHESNKEREKAGYEPIELVGWAEHPYYDRASKKLFWGKELEFGSRPDHTLNYDIRVLGRKGYLVMKAVASMSQLEQIKPSMQQVLGMVAFNPGNRYEDFKPGSDKVAAYGIAALVAGGVLAKVGFFKLLIVGIIALKKFLIIGIIAVIAGVKGLFGKKKKEQVMKVEEQVRKVE